MTWLELRVPPVIVVVFFAALTALAKKCDIGVFRASKQFDLWVMLPMALGIIVIVLGIVEFKRSQTTVDPMHPDKTSNLVTSGIFARTRNPMYLGMLLLMISGTIYAGSWIGFICSIGLGLYLNQFQIKPEERVIEGIFGQAYLDYKQRVRRWI
jgi:protein-S-isoprenylcysteine O-methyltransferase Ste14